MHLLKGLAFRRWASRLSSNRVFNFQKPTEIMKPARTRFAPSPTGFLHMGSLRTALYNYLYAKHTGGQFLLRLEDTDQKRLVEGAEENLYDCLNWLGLKYDEGPQIGGPFGPYRQSDRKEIYAKYADELVKKGLAYYCFCSKERLGGLRESAMKLKPPTNVTYDRHCSHISQEEIEDLKSSNDNYTIRFKSPDKYPSFDDLLHGNMTFQPQTNELDKRFDDFIIMKSDGLPTYHFANIIDDHLMNITHVIRGEEWLPATPKHIALYDAFGWSPPKFTHVPLLTSSENKKLSKRAADNNIWSLKDEGILPETLINFAVLFGWSLGKSTKGVSESEMFSLDELVSKFDISGLTKGNAQVDPKKLYHFNKIYLNKRINNHAQLIELVDEYYPKIISDEATVTKEKFTSILKIVSPGLSSMNELSDFNYLFQKPAWDSQVIADGVNITTDILLQVQAYPELPTQKFDDLVKFVRSKVEGSSQKNIYHALRFALSGTVSGIKLPDLIQILGQKESNERIKESVTYLQSL